MAEISQLRLRGVVYDLRDKTKISISEKGAPYGVAELDENGQISSEQIPTRIRYGKTEEWDSDKTYIPQKSEIVIYSDYGTTTEGDEEIPVPRIKVGDGLAYLVDLPFIGDDQTKIIMDILNGHVNDTSVHVSDADRERWDNKLNYSLSDENLVLNRE